MLSPSAPVLQYGALMTNLSCQADGEGAGLHAPRPIYKQIHNCNAVLKPSCSYAARVVDRHCSRSERVPILGSVQWADTRDLAAWVAAFSTEEA